MKFNEDSRQKNAMLASVFAIVEQIFSVASVFIYRTIFLSYLSKEYLGIEGLFTNILYYLSDITSIQSVRHSLSALFYL